MKNYYRVMLGRKSVYAAEAHKGQFIGIGFLPDTDLTSHLPENWREFNKEFIPQVLALDPEKTKISAGLACGMLWTVAKGIQVGDIVLCPDGQGKYLVGQVTSDYQYVKGNILPHRRSVSWFSTVISRDEMSDSLKHSTGAIGTISNVSQYAEEIDTYLNGVPSRGPVSVDEGVEDQSVFALEKHLEDFLVQNWKSTEIGRSYDIYEEDGEIVGQQYPSDTGPIDILAISKDKKEILVVELKRGKAADVVVGQIQRYMGYVKEELAEDGQKVSGTIIAFEDDLRIRRALSVTQNINFYTYKVQFKLEKR